MDHRARLNLRSQLSHDIATKTINGLLAGHRHELDIAGLAVPKGDYTLYVWVKDSEAWQLIVNKQTGQWGDSYNASQDVGRVRMTMSKPAVLVEKLQPSS